MPIRPRRAKRVPAWVHLIPVGLLAFGLFVTVARDLFRLAVGGRGEEPPGVTGPGETVIAVNFHDKEEEVTLTSGGGGSSDSGDSRADDQDVDVCCHLLTFVSGLRLAELLSLRLAKRVATRSSALKIVQ